MIESKINEYKKILDTKIGLSFKIVKDKRDFIEVYGPGINLTFKKGDMVTLKKYNYAEKIKSFMVLISNKKETLWVPLNFLDIEIDVDKK